LAICEILAIALALLAKANGAPVVGGLLIIVFVNLMAALVYFVWQRAIVPGAKQVEESGLVGVTRTLYGKLLRPVLYGRSKA
jgi:hypothetical protein